MGRHLKKGLDYFNIDCVQEDSLNYLEAKHGISGYGVLVKLWRKIYMIEGYYCDWSEKNIYLFAKEVVLEVEMVKSIVETCISEGIFHREMYKNYGVLTSHGVQKRWLRIVLDAKRKDIAMEAKLVISAKTMEETGFTPEEISKTPEESTQRKVKEIKEEESKEKKSNKAPAEPEPEDLNLINPFSPEFMQAWNDWKDHKGKEFKFKYKSFKGEKASFMELINLSKKSEITARQIILQSMAKGWKGFFELQNGTEPDKTVTIPGQIVQKLDKIAHEINYLFDTFREDSTKCTMISIDSAHYDYLKKAGKIQFSDDQITAIARSALQAIQEKGLEPSDEKMKVYMKKFGVLEFFEVLQKTGAEAVFHEA